jgi:hypothetical protein
MVLSLLKMLREDTARALAAAKPVQ